MSDIGKMYTMLPFNRQYIGGVILLMLSIGSTVSAMDPLGVFAGCVKSENIPPLTSESNSLLRTTFEIIQSASLSEAVLKCVSNKIGQLRNSSDTTEWFIAHTFDPMIVKKNTDHAVSVYKKDKDYSCLRSVALTQEQCFMLITSLVQQSEITAANVCTLPLDQCMNFTRFENDCRSDEITIIEAATALFYGKCFTAREHTNIIPTTTRMPDGLPNSAFFRCGDKIFPGNDLAMLFPPSDLTNAQIVNVTAAKEEQKQSMETFCMKIQEYGMCVEDGLMAPQSPLDNAMSQVIDKHHIGDAFQHYCSLKELVTSTFECTKNNLRSKCYGGVIDVIFRLNSELKMMDITEQCKAIKQSRSCRITNQLMPCGQNYANGMEMFYNMLLSPMCLNETDEIDYGDGYKCFDSLAMEMYDLFKNISGVETFKTALITAMRTVCSQKSQWMPCLRNVHKTSKKSFDKLIFELLIPDNIEAVTDFVCSKVDDFDKHGLCVIKSVETVDHKKDNCTLTLVNKMTPIFETPHGDLHKKISEFCGYVKPFATCGKRLLFDNCDTNLANDAMTLGTILDKSCNNPNPFDQTAKPTQTTTPTSESSVSSISAVIVLGVAILVHVLDI